MARRSWGPSKRGAGCDRQRAERHAISGAAVARAGADAIGEAMGTELVEVRSAASGSPRRAAPGRPRACRLAEISGVDVASEDVPSLGSTTEHNADLDRALEQITEVRVALKDHVAGKFDLRH